MRSLATIKVIWNTITESLPPLNETTTSSNSSYNHLILFKATSNTETIEKEITFRFVLKKEDQKDNKIVIKPVYCTGNFNATATLASFSEDNGLSASDWKTNSLGGFYFDCDSKNKDFKLDPVKVEKG